MECLLEILRDGNVGSQLEDTEWVTVLALAEEERVLPSIVERLRACGNDLPQPVTDRLNQAERDASIAAFYWCAQLKGVLRAFHQANILVVPLKGPLLAERLYASKASRTYRDLDLLVRQVDFARAEAVLEELGFAPGELDDYHRPWYRGGVAVELHYDVENPLAFDFGVDSAIRAAVPTMFEGEMCLQLTPHDELVFLCLHAARHRYERLCLVLDLQLAFEKLSSPVSGCQPGTQIAGMNNLVLLGLAMARRLQPGLCVALSPGHDSERLEQLAEVLWNRLLTQRSEPLDWGAVHAFYLEVERPGLARLRRRVRHLQILFTRMIEPDYRFAARFGMHRTWQVRMLRPLRLLSASIQSRSRQAI